MAGDLNTLTAAGYGEHGGQGLRDHAGAGRGLCPRHLRRSHRLLLRWLETFKRKMFNMSKIDGGNNQCCGAEIIYLRLRLHLCP